MNHKKHGRPSHLAIGIIIGILIVAGAIYFALQGPIRSSAETTASAALADLFAEKNFSASADVDIALEDQTEYLLSLSGNFAIPEWLTNGRVSVTIKPPFQQNGSSGGFKFFGAGEDFFASLTETTLRPPLVETLSDLSSSFLGRWYQLPPDLVSPPSARDLERIENQIRDALIIHSREKQTLENGDLEIVGAWDAVLISELLRKNFDLSANEAVAIRDALRNENNEVKIVISPENRLRQIETLVSLPLPQFGDSEIAATINFSEFGISSPKTESPRGSILLDPRLFLGE